MLSSQVGSLLEEPLRIGNLLAKRMLYDVSYFMMSIVERSIHLYMRRNGLS